MIRKIILCLMLLGLTMMTTGQSLFAQTLPSYDTPSEKVEEYRLAAQNGDPVAKFNLGILTAMGWAGLKKDEAKSRELLLQSAEQGYSEAQIWVASLALTGEITGKSSAPQAVKWYIKAAGQGSKLAYFQLGCLYREWNEIASFLNETEMSRIEFEPLKQDKELSKEYWIKSGLSKNRVELIDALFIRISKGDWKAHKELSEMLSEKNLIELKPDILIFFHSAKFECHLFDSNLEKAKNGDINAMIDVAKSYEYPRCPGHPVADLKEQLYWLDKASKKGSVQALYELGCYYSQNDKIKDPEKSFRYYMEAAEKGHAAAMCSLAIIYEGKNDLIESMRWMLKAAEAGDKDSFFYLGHRYQNGEGVPVNFVKAYAWFSIWSYDEKEGTEGIGRRRLKELTAQMSPGRIAEAQELAAQIWVRLEKKLSPSPNVSAEDKVRSQIILDIERYKLRTQSPK
jgi:uncharacterized protein